MPPQSGMYFRKVQNATKDFGICGIALINAASYRYISSKGSSQKVTKQNLGKNCLECRTGLLPGTLIRSRVIVNRIKGPGAGLNTIVVFL